MPRISSSDPIFQDHGGVNQLSDLIDPMAWTSALPGTTFYQAMEVDPGLSEALGVFNPVQFGSQVRRAVGDNPSMDAIGKFIEEGTSTGLDYLREAAIYDTVSSVRSTVGQIATTVGFGREMLSTNVNGLFNDPLQDVVKGFNFVDKIFSNAGVQAALDGLTVVPYVGQIIRIATAAMKMIASISAAIDESKEKEMMRELAKRHHVPLLDADHDLQNATNTYMTRQILWWSNHYQTQQIYMPPFLSENGHWEDVMSSAARDEDGQKYKDQGGKSVGLTDAWYIHGRPGLGGGGGFMPGGTEILRQIQLYAGQAGADPLNTGRFMPSARSMAGYTWQTQLQSGPSMFAIDTHTVRRAWDNYVRALVGYNQQCVSKGFTVSATGYDCSDKAWDLKEKELVKLPSTANHADELGPWIRRQFWGRGPNQDQFPYPTKPSNALPWGPNNLALDATVYAAALKNLYERQLAVVRGYDAFSVTPATNVTMGPNPDGTGGVPATLPFPALRNDPDLLAAWENTIRTVLNDKELRRGVRWQDVPEYTWKGTSVRQALRQRQQSFQTMLAAGPIPHVPGGPNDYPPPAPPSLVGGDAQPELNRMPLAAMAAGVYPWRSLAILGSLLAAGAAGAGGVMLYNRVKGR